MIYFYFAEIEFLKHKHAIVLIPLMHNLESSFKYLLEKKVTIFMITHNRKKQLFGVDEYQ